jgi:hypothetical protein
LVRSMAKTMDGRVKPGHDGHLATTISPVTRGLDRVKPGNDRYGIGSSGFCPACSCMSTAMSSAAVLA